MSMDTIDSDQKVLEEVEIAPFEEHDEQAHDRFTHIVNPTMNPHIWDGSMEMTAQDVVDLARTFGIEIVALCEYTWVPKYNPERYPACPTCMDTAHNMISGS